MDPPLTERGLQQARLAGERLAARGASEVIASDARRARETAEVIAERIGGGMTVSIEPELTEMRLPDWSHLSLEEVALEFRKSREREPQAWWEGLPGGENFRAFLARIQRALAKILRERGVRRVEGEEAAIWRADRDLGRLVVVGHGGTNSVAMALLLGLPSVPWEWERFGLNHASFLRLTTVPLGRGFIFSLRSFNDCEHLPKHLRTA